MTFFRYRLRLDEMGWTVYDVWTGWPVIIDEVMHVGMDEESAGDLAFSLETVTMYGDRRVHI